MCSSNLTFFKKSKKFQQLSSVHRHLFAVVAVRQQQEIQIRNEKYVGLFFFNRSFGCGRGDVTCLRTFWFDFLTKRGETTFYNLQLCSPPPISMLLRCKGANTFVYIPFAAGVYDFGGYHFGH